MVIKNFYTFPSIVALVAKAQVADKRYYLITHIVDKLIEPPLHEMGHDLYAGDAHVGLVNVSYRAGHMILPDGHWDRVLRSALRAMQVDLKPHQVEAALFAFRPSSLRAL